MDAAHGREIRRHADMARARRRLPLADLCARADTSAESRAGERAVPGAADRRSMLRRDARWFSSKLFGITGSD